jgi:hypothetical protein
MRIHVSMARHIPRAGDPLLSIRESVVIRGHAPVDRRPLLGRTSRSVGAFCGGAFAGAGSFGGDVDSHGLAHLDVSLGRSGDRLQVRMEHGPEPPA